MRSQQPQDSNSAWDRPRTVHTVTKMRKITLVCQTYLELSSFIDAQHGTAVPIPKSSFFILLALFPQLRWWPDHFAMCIILVMQVALLSTVICRINCFAITVAMVGAAPMGKVRPKDQQMSYEKPSMLRVE